MLSKTHGGVLTLCVVWAMSLRKRPAACSPNLDDCNLRQLVLGGTKIGLMTTIEKLSGAGLLKPGVLNANSSALRQRLDTAQRSHSIAKTPYGTVLQSMPLPLKALPHWEFIHPLALLHYLSTLSVAFGNIMERCGTPGRSFRLILYIDEICPGNPLRPEKSRTLQAIYWALADWPQWLLQRTAAWPCFGTIRSKLVEKLPGGVANLMKIVLLQFFPRRGPSFKNGVTIVLGSGERLVCTGLFCGFLCDEKAHNQVVGSKGASGTKPCLTCKNCFGRVKDSAILAGCISIKCDDSRKFDRHTNESVYECYDLMAAEGNATELKKLQQYFGLKVNKDGLFGDDHVRAMYKPVDHMLRDPMHILLNNGVANVELARLVHTLMQWNITIQMIMGFAMTFTLPHRNGKVEEAWISKNRLGKKCKCLNSFCGILLSLIPIIVCFLVDTIDDDHTLADHKKCFILLSQIIGICSLGPEDAIPYIELLRELIAQHAELFVRLYPNSVRPKFHQLFHIVDNMEFLGSLLSCFVTERKHRATKRAALFVFRSIDNTVIKDILNRHCEAVSDGGGSLFQECYLVSPTRFCFGGASLQYSRRAVLRCGELRAGDLVYLSSDEVGEVVNFWSHDGTAAIAAQLLVFQPSAVAHSRWCPKEATHRVTDAAGILDAVTWQRVGDEVRVILPFKMQLQMRDAPIVAH